MSEEQSQAFIEPNTIYSPSEILEWCTTGKPINLPRAVESSIPFRSKFALFDIPFCLHDRSFKEDALYSEELFLKKNIRSGNSIMIQLKETKNSSGADKPSRIMRYSYSNAWFVRRGMQKIFELYPEFTFQCNTKDLNTIGSFAGNYPLIYSQDPQRELMRKLIFYDVEETIIRKGLSVDVYRTTQANGESAQISYSRQLDAWIISSKNVSIAARREEDLYQLHEEKYIENKYMFESYEEKYIESKYMFAKLIGFKWFDYVNSLNRNLVENLKNDLDGFTFIGEYVGNQKYQHLVKYNENTILFFAYVDNNSPHSFMPPLKAFSLFKKYNLNRVEVEYIGNMRTLEELYRNLGDLYNKISSEALTEGEGSVIYLLENQNPDNPILYAANTTIFGNQPENFTEQELSQAILSQFALSAIKIKTLEYKIFRMLREKIKKVISDRGMRIPSSKVRLKKFMHKTQDFSRYIEPPKPLDYYFKIAEVAFASISQYPSESRFNEGFIYFLDTIILRINSAKPSEICDKEINSEKCIEELNPLIVTIVTPPFILDKSEKNAICDALKSTKIEKTWNKKIRVKEGLTVCFPLEFMEIKDRVPEIPFLYFIGPQMRDLKNLKISLECAKG
ncbi:unnamed protein product [Blepharisma stoltei]|uniref:Uncharacterized protein n=1 Tax=Blepharisma stoltei TaxID=1481888 RepID=A0AAU9IQQ8_9CILI|nr:unnamed protein product [Blepharisma stoltei]